MEIFHDWFRAVPPQPYCVPCLAKMYEKPEALIQAALDRRSDVTRELRECWACLNGLRVTYRVKRDASG